MISLVHLSTSYNAFGGIENSVYNLAKGFCDINETAFLYVANKCCFKGYKNRLRMHGSKLLSLDWSTIDSISKCVSNKKDYINVELEKLSRRYNFKVIQAHDANWGILYHTEPWNSFKGNYFLRLHMAHDKKTLENIRKQPWTGVSVVSSYLKKEIFKIHSNARIDAVIPNSIDTNMFIRKNKLYNNNNEIIFCPSRFANKKGIIILLEAFKNLLKHKRNLTLWLCGGKSLFKNEEHNNTYSMVLNYVYDNGISKNVIIFDNIRWDNMPKYYIESDIVVIPSLDETFGRVALEALSCGLPTIVTRVGNLPDLVEDSAIVAETSSDSLLAALDRLINDKGLRNFYKDRGPLISKNYSNRLVASQFKFFFGMNR